MAQSYVSDLVREISVLIYRLYKFILRYICERTLCYLSRGKVWRMCFRPSEHLIEVYMEAKVLYNRIKGTIRQRCYAEAILFVALLAFVARLLGLNGDVKKYLKEVGDLCTKTDNECFGAIYIMCINLGAKLDYRHLHMTLKKTNKALNMLDARSATAELVRLALCSRETYNIPAARCILTVDVVSEMPREPESKEIIEMCVKMKNEIKSVWKS